MKKDQERVEQVDKQNEEITIEEAGVRKDQERDELEITIKKAEVMKDQGRIEPAEILQVKTKGVKDHEKQND